MANPHADLQALAVRRAPATNGPMTLRPPRHWISRTLLPLGLLAGFAGLLIWASWDLLVPSTPVSVTPVVARAGIVQATGVELFKATGWIEPRPNPIEVTALAEGVVEKLLVLPGQRVQAGDVVARLIAVDAELAAQAAQEDLVERKTKVRLAEADLVEAAANLKAAEAALKGQEDLKEFYGRLPHIQAVAARDMAKAKIEQGKARLQEAEARVRQGEIAVRTAALRLERMAVRTPVSGIVMNYTVRPGRMVGGRSLAGGQHDSLMTLYDPERLQLRVRVPIDKFQLVQPGQPAEVEVDVLPGRRLPGTVLYDTHEADINQNFMYVKVGLTQYSPRLFAPLLCLPGQTLVQTALLAAAGESLKEFQGPHDKLRPEMLASIRFISPPSETKETGGEILRIFVPQALVVNAEGESRAWIVDQTAGRAMLRTVVLGSAKQGELVEVTQGLQPSDKLITSGRELLKPGQRVRITGE